jgi:hypothetical protein
MTSRMVLAALILAATSVSGWAADPTGHYKVEGANPGGGSPYSGEVTVAKTGDTYKVEWVIGGTTYSGTGIGDQDFITVSYSADGQTGVALYGHDMDGWKGAWTYAGGTKLGYEVWTAE